jgi:hypothetical protein
MLWKKLEKDKRGKEDIDGVGTRKKLEKNRGFREKKERKKDKYDKR